MRFIQNIAPWNLASAAKSRVLLILGRNLSERRGESLLYGIRTLAAVGIIALGDSLIAHTLYNHLQKVIDRFS